MEMDRFVSKLEVSNKKQNGLAKVTLVMIQKNLQNDENDWKRKENRNRYG